MSFLKRVISVSVFALTLYILLVGSIGNLFKDYFITEAKYQMTYWILLIPIIFIIFLLLKKYFNWLNSKSVKLNRIIFWVFTGVFLIISFYMISSFTVSLTRDPIRVVNGAVEIAKYGKLKTIGTYFDRATNNFGITYILGLWLKMLSPLGMSIWMMLKLFTLIQVFISLFSLVLSVKYIFKNQQITTFAITLLTIFPIYTWYFLIVPYSDQTALVGYSLMILAATRIYQKSKISLVWLIFASLITIVATLVKANFFVIAPVLFIWVIYLFTHKRLSLNLFLFFVLVSGTAIGTTIYGNKIIEQKIKYKVNKEYQFPIQHWIMMGLNKNTEGSYSDNDVNITINAGKTLQERKKFDNLVISDRLQSMGVLGYFQLATSKLSNLQSIGKQPKNYIDQFSKAPDWYVDNVNISREAISIAQRIFYITASVFGSIYLIRIFKHKANDNDDLFVLSALMIDGLLTFHALFWESNDRYGSAIIPGVILLSLAGIVESLVLENKILENKKLISVAGVFALIGILILPVISNTAPLKDRIIDIDDNLKKVYNPNRLRVTDTKVNANFIEGQLGRWGSEFNYPYSKIFNNGEIEQKINLNEPAKILFIKISVSSGKEIRVYYFKNDVWKEVANSKNDLIENIHISGQIGLSGKFNPGEYKIQVINKTGSTKKLMLQGSPVINGSDYLGGSYINKKENVKLPFSHYRYTIPYVWGK